MRHRLLTAFALVLAFALAVPAAASAHGLVGRADLPVPGWLFIWGAGVMLVVSFVALAALWPNPQLQGDRGRPVAWRLGSILSHRAFETVCGAIGVALMCVVVWSGAAGTFEVGENFAAVFVFVIFWVGLVPASVLLGDVYRLFNPWRAIGRAVGWVLERAMPGGNPEPTPYPAWLGYWPAVLGLIAFTWLELIQVGGSIPRNIAWATLVYGAVQLVGQAAFGVEAWTRRGDAFAVLFNLYSRIGIFELRERRIVIRRPLSALTGWPVEAGSVALLATIIGTVTYDGGAEGPIWGRDLFPHIFKFWGHFTNSFTRQGQLTQTTGLLGAIVLIGAFYALGIAGARTVGGEVSLRRLRATFVHTLAPIALAYASAHYFSLLVYTGQSIAAVASDPLGHGWNLFGTAHWTINYGVINTTAIWYIQLGFVLTGHILALTLAHDRALAIYDRARLAVRSQYWMLAVMVGYTSLALYLLHTLDTVG